MPLFYKFVIPNLYKILYILSSKIASARIIAYGFACTISLSFFPLSVTSAAILQDYRIGITQERTRVVYEFDTMPVYSISQFDSSIAASFEDIYVPQRVKSKIRRYQGGILDSCLFKINDNHANFDLMISKPYELHNFELVLPYRLVLDLYPVKQSKDEISLSSDKESGTKTILPNSETVKPAEIKTDLNNESENTESIHQVTPVSGKKTVVVEQDPIRVASAPHKREIILKRMDEKNIVFSLKPQVQFSFGESSYYIRTLSPVDNQPGEFNKYESKLVFPLDGSLAGLTFELTSASHLNRYWSFNASFLINLREPEGKMKDNDWINNTHVYHTDSEADLDMKIVNTSLKYQFYRGIRTSIMFSGSLYYQNIEQDISGYQGWYLSPVSSQLVQISGEESVLSYGLSYLSPQMGVSSLIRLNHIFAVELEGSSGLVFASDRDDHLQRGKLSEADAVGYALSGMVKISILPDPAAGRPFSLDLLGSARYFHAEGNQTQRWYQDDNGIPVGTVIKNIPHEFESLQYNLGLRIGYSF